MTHVLPSLEGESASW
jgi:hypothetical protein